MNTITLPIHDSLYERVREFTEREHISLNQFISSAIAEKLAVFTEEEYFEKRFGHITEKDFKEALSYVPDVEPDEYDKL